MSTLTGWRRPARRCHSSPAASAAAAMVAWAAGADRERGGQRRLGTGEFDRIERSFGLVGRAPKRGENAVWIWGGHSRWIARGGAPSIRELRSGHTGPSPVCSRTRVYSSGAEARLVASKFAEGEEP